MKDFSINQIIENLKNKTVDNKHFLPQSFFLGDDPNYFNIKASIKNLKFLEEYLNHFFQKNLTLPRIQDGGGSEGEIILTKEQKNAIREIYKLDYKFISNN